MRTQAALAVLAGVASALLNTSITARALKRDRNQAPLSLPTWAMQFIALQRLSGMIPMSWVIPAQSGHLLAWLTRSIKNNVLYYVLRNMRYADSTGHKRFMKRGPLFGTRAISSTGPQTSYVPKPHHYGANPEVFPPAPFRAKTACS